ncbi:MAG: alpha/beta fold hydrolase [Gemmatimonadaceae bacterium]
MRTLFLALGVCVVNFAQTTTAAAQRPAGLARATRDSTIPIDTARARLLYVGIKPSELPQGNFAALAKAKLVTDSIYSARLKGVADFQKITYKSSDGLEIPAYIFQPLTGRAPKQRAAMVWIHGGVHGDWTELMLPFVVEAVQRGYVIIAPDYRGSAGHGKALYNAIDYGGREVDDIVAAGKYLAALPYVDPTRVGVMGWSHGAYISALSVMRESHPFRAAGAVVPVTNLVFRLGYKGPTYALDFAAEPTIGGLPFEKQAEYIKRSPLYQVDALRVPLMVHFATNDTNVNFVEAEQLVNALKVKKPDLAEVKVYDNPGGGDEGGGHTFSRRVDPKTLERNDTPEQRDSWNRTWTFFEWNLRAMAAPKTPL